MYILLFSPVTWQQQMHIKIGGNTPQRQSNLWITLIKIEIFSTVIHSHSLKEFIIIGNDIKISKFPMDWNWYKNIHISKTKDF
jgi:hypothetical protein